MRDRESEIESDLRRRAWLIPALTAVAAAALYAGLGLCLQIYRQDHTSIVVLSGLVAHALMVVLVHDGAHRAITRTGADRYVCNIGAGLLLLPFYGEAFRRYHLIHHRHTNSELDPLFSPGKARLFRDHRLVYMATDQALHERGAGDHRAGAGRVLG